MQRVIKCSNETILSDETVARHQGGKQGDGVVRELLLPRPVKLAGKGMEFGGGGEPGAGGDVSGGGFARIRFFVDSLGQVGGCGEGLPEGQRLGGRGEKEARDRREQMVPCHFHST